MGNYVQVLITRFDQLALIGKIIDHDDQVESIINGLSDDYKYVVDQLEGQEILPSLTELHENLLNHEAKFMKMTPPSFFPITANYAHNRNRSNNNNKPNQPQHHPWLQQHQL